MAKYCTSCGTRIPEGSAFCPECGAPVAAAAAAPESRGSVGFADGENCRSCGAQLPPGMKVCPYCGSKQNASPAPPDRGYAAPGPRSSSSARGEAPRSSSAARNGYGVRGPSSGPNRSSTTRPDAREAAPRTRGRGVARLLVLVMLAELGVAAFKYPGFLRKKEPDPSLVKPPVSQTARPSATAKPDVTPRPTDSGGQPPIMDEVVVPGLAEQIAVRYSQKEIAAAPAATAAVSKEKPIASCGGLKVDFKSWNLPDEADTFTVRSLGTQTDYASGWELECWDLSLASGTHEFFTNIEVTVPRSGEDGASTGFVCYNEETGKWENVYSRISDDGGSYLVYMQHFSPLAKRSILGWKEKPAGQGKGSSSPSQLFDEFEVDSELFIELIGDLSRRGFENYRDSGNDRMQSAVRLDYNRYWAMAEQGKLKGIDLVLGQYARGSISIQNAFRELAEVNASGTGKTLGTATGTALSLTDLLEAGPKAGTPLARIFGGMSAYLGFMDVAAAYTRITYDAQLRQKTITESILEDHKMDLVSGVTGALTAVSGTAAALGFEVPTPVTWGLAAVSLTIFAAGQTTSALQSYSMSGITDMMFNYYSTHYPLGSVTGMTNLSGIPLRRFQDMLAAHPLTHGTHTVVAEDGTETEVVDDSWVQLISCLVQLNKEFPEEVPVEKIPLILNELVDIRAWRFFELSDRTLQSVLDKARDEKYQDWDYLLYRPIYEGYTQDDADRLYAYETARLRVAASKAAEQVMESQIQKARQETEEYLDKYLVDQLNHMVLFHVADAAAEDFRDSAYYRDFYDYPGNRDWMLTREEADKLYAKDSDNWEMTVVDYADEALMLPISFADISEPYFVPSVETWIPNPDPEGEELTVKVAIRVSANEYYPNADNFIPRPGAYRWEDNDVVFECTVYHYMMMGCPGAMTFRTYPEEAMDKPKDGEEPKSYPPDSEVTVTFARELDRMEYKESKKEYHLYIRVDGAISIEAFEGDWVMRGSGYKATLRVEYTSGTLRVYEIYEDEEGEDMEGGIMDEYRLDQKNKMLIIGDDRLEGGSMKITLKDETHITLVSGTGTFELTKETVE